MIIANSHNDKTNTLYQEAQDIEELAWWDIYKAAPDHYFRKHGLRAIRLPGGTCFAHRNFPAWDFNRVLKFGISPPATEKSLQTIQLWMQKNAGPIYNIGVDPNIQSEEVTEKLREFGFSISDGGMTRFFYDVKNSVSVVESSLSAREIAPHESGLLGTLFREAFDLPAGFDTWLGQLAGRADWRIFIAYDGLIPIGTGALYVKNGLAWLGLGATLKDYRRRGAQSLLLSLRVSEAKKMGAHSIHIETETPEPGTPTDSSFRNILKAGFKVLYTRKHYISTPAKSRS